LFVCKGELQYRSDKENGISSEGSDEYITGFGNWPDPFSRLIKRSGKRRNHKEEPVGMND